MRQSTVPLLLTLWVPSVASAGEALKVDLVPKAQQGKGQPALVVSAEVELSKLTLDVTRSTDGKRFKQVAGRVLAGRKHEFSLSVQAVGPARFEGKLAVELGNGESGEMPIAVDVELVAPLELRIDQGDVDLEKKVLRLRPSRPVVRVQISTMSDVGTPLGTVEKSWSGAAVGAEGPVEVAWKQGPGTVMRIAIQAWDQDEFFGSVELFPWRVDIPHEEVNFATGSFDITEAEAPKLERSFEALAASLDKYGALAKVRLFIAGHTDTVGEAPSNQTLSNNRARAIGRWFRRRGVRVPILYAGFGESLLAVQTPDDTDEVRNRRAEYIVAVDPPRLSGAARWAPLDE